MEEKLTFLVMMSRLIFLNIKLLIQSGLSITWRKNSLSMSYMSTLYFLIKRILLWAENNMLAFHQINRKRFKRTIEAIKDKGQIHK